MSLHPVIARMIEADVASGRRAPADLSVAQARVQAELAARASGSGPQVEVIQDLVLPSRGGLLSARLLRSAARARGLMVYLHGGGWMMGSVHSSEVIARELAARCQCAVLSIAYRLAPEHPFPAGLEDVEDAIGWAAVHRQALSGSERPLVVAGDSAGANLATVAAVTLSARVDIALQLLFYPVTDTAMDSASYRAFADGPRLTARDMRCFLQHYAPAAAWDDPRIAPLRHPAPAGAPPAWIATAAYDVLRDEGEAYARRLAAAGVLVRCTRYAGMVHGFARWAAQVDVARHAFNDAAQAVRQIAWPGAPPRFGG